MSSQSTRRPVVDESIFWRVHYQYYYHCRNLDKFIIQPFSHLSSWSFIIQVNYVFVFSFFSSEGVPLRLISSGDRLRISSADNTNAIRWFPFWIIARYTIPKHYWLLYQNQHYYIRYKSSDCMFNQIHKFIIMCCVVTSTMVFTIIMTMNKILQVPACTVDSVSLHRRTCCTVHTVHTVYS